LKNRSVQVLAQVAIASLVAGVRSGRWLISFPTDTVPALACHPEQAELIFRAKQRQPDKPLILMAADAVALWPYVQGNTQEWREWHRIAGQVWPGAVTLVLPASHLLPPALNPAGEKTIGLRVPDWAIAQAILEQTGPLATTSINRSGQPPLVNLVDVEAEFPQVFTPTAQAWQLPTALDAQAPAPSTVVRWTGSDWKVLRQGKVYLNLTGQTPKKN
jgi:L-threonylcarbamoyladenylate synthase